MIELRIEYCNLHGFATGCRFCGDRIYTEPVMMTWMDDTGRPNYCCEKCFESGAEGIRAQLKQHAAELRDRADAEDALADGVILAASPSELQKKRQSHPLCCEFAGSAQEATA